MSYTTVYGFDEDGNARQLGEFKNSFRGAMLIWMELSKKYLNDEYAVMSNDGRKVWELRDNPDLSDDEWYSLLSTFDNMVVGRNLINRVADALDAFDPATENLRGQAACLRVAYNEGYQAVAWCQTSVIESPWWIVGRCISPDGDCIECEDCMIDRGGRPYNLNVDKNHYFMEERKAYMG